MTGLARHFILLLLSKIIVSWTGQSRIGAVARSYRPRFSEEAPGFDDLMRRCRWDGRDALPRDPRQDVRWLRSGADRIRVPARPAQHVHRRVPDLRSRTRRSASTIGGGLHGT